MKSLWFLPLLALCGCMALSVPRSEFRGSIGGQPFAVASPKDSELTDLVIESRSVDVFGGTNYAVIRVGKLRTRMNPEIIQTTAAAQSQLVTDIGRELRSVAATGASAAAK